MKRKLNFIKGKMLSGKQYYRTDKLPDIKTTESDKTYKARAGERLENIAYKFYGDPTYWWIIAKANGITDGTFALNDGKILTIPTISLF